MTDPTRFPWVLSLQTALLVAANAGLAWLMAWAVLGPTLATATAIGVAVAALVAAPVRSRAVLRRQGGVPLPADDWVTRVVATLAARAGIERPPEVFLMPGRIANAMAVGDRHDGALAVTEGAVQLLDDDELGGVLAHEVAHLAHGDTRLLAIAALAGRITGVLAQIALLLLFVGLPLVLVGALRIQPLLLLTIVVAPTVAALLQLALSRTREFAADRRAAALLGDPHGLARALERIEATSRRRLPPWLAPYAGGVHPWLQSHPSTTDRVRALRALPNDPRIPPLPRRHRQPTFRPGPRTLLRLLFGRW